MQPQEQQRDRIMLSLLESVGRDGAQSQRSMATQFDVALGLVNAYLKICIKKGYVKAKRMPARRYAYLLTPKGFAEKSRLTLLMLSNQLELFRRARADYAALFREAKARGWKRVALIGATELAEISAICALEAELQIAAIVDPIIAQERFVGCPVVAKLSDRDGFCDGAIITDVVSAHQKYAAAVAELGEARVLGPAVLGLPGAPREGVA